MTATESDILHQLVQQVNAMQKQLNKNTDDTAAIRRWADNLDGGRKALMWVAGIAVSVGFLIVALVKK